MQFQIHQEIGARFKLVVRKTDGSIARETAWFKNLVLDTGLARMSVGTWIDRCCVGTGNSTPVAAQVQLDAFLASTTTQQSSSSLRQVSTSPYYYSANITWRFGQGVAAGNISEVGLGWGNANLWNRALIKDANGNPTTITVLSDEYLDVVSEVRVYPAQNLSGSFNLLDKTGEVISTHTYTGLPYIGWDGNNFNKISINRGYVWGNDMWSVTAFPGNNIADLYPEVTYPTATSLHAVCNIDLNSGNGVQKSLTLLIEGLLTTVNNNGYTVQVSPPITKTAAQKMTYTFDLSWGRYTA